MTKKVLVAIVVIVLVAAILFVLGRSTPSPVIVESPAAGATISSPVTITGKAKGSWYFEATFPVRILDALGNVIASGPAQAQGDWMTSDYVPFTATLTFTVPTPQYGKIVLAKDNPSGKPENDAQETVAVWLDSSDNASTSTAAANGSTTTATTSSVQVFFGLKSDPTGDCATVGAIQRVIPKTQAVARAALDELLKGPSTIEAAKGFTTSIPSGVKVQKLSIENGIAYADFSKELDAGVAGSCRVTAIRSQIEQTLMQFGAVQRVVISIDGKTEGILQP